jgi:hypothetical protein
MSVSDEDVIDRAAVRLIDAGLADEAALQGCRADGLAQLERSLGVTLPSIYRQFLARMGRSAGAFLTGTDFLFARLADLRGDAERLLEEVNSPFRLTKADVVFAMHQGYQFLYFTTGEAADPPVFLFTDDSAEPRRVYAHFSEWLSACITDEIAAWQETHRR